MDSPWKGRIQTFLLLAAVLAAVVAIAVSLRSIVPQAPTLDLQLEGRVAFLPFVNLTGDPQYDWVEHGLMEMLATSLERTPGIGIVPPQRLAKLIAERQLDPKDDGARVRIRQLAAALGGEVIVDVALRRTRTGESELPPLSGPPQAAFAFDVRIHDADGRQVVNEELRAMDPLLLADLLAFSLVRGLPSQGEPVRIAKALATSPFLARLHGMGLQALRSQGPAEARPIFELAQGQQAFFLETELALATCHRRLGDLAASRELAKRVLEEAQARGERRLQVASLAEIGHALAIEGSLEAATELYGQGLAILRILDDKSRQGATLFELARLARSAGNDEQAAKLFDERYALQASVGDVPGQIDTLVELASLSLGVDDFEGAETSLRSAQRLAHEVDDLWLQMQVIASRGELASQRKDADEAIALWDEAFTFYRQQGDGPRQLLLSNKLANLHLEKRNFEQAEELLHHTRELAVELERPAIEAAASLRLAWLLLRTGYPLQARTHVERTLELDRWIVEDRLSLQLVIAWLAYEQGNYRLAVDTQIEARRQHLEAWRPLDDAFLAVYRQALALGQRVPVPGE